jgi:hypothetical protein
MCLPLVLLIAVPFKVFPFQVYATGPAFLPLLELTFWNHVDDQHLFLTFIDILETTSFWLQFHSQKQEEMARGQIRQVRRVGDHRHVFSGQKSLHRQSSVHQHIVIVKQPVLVLPSFWTFLADLLLQTLQNP